MKKHIILLGTLTLSAFIYAQEGAVGINTDQPKATLDVMASPDVATRVDGFIAPRIKGNELKAKDALYGANQTGAIVYASEAASPTTAKTVNVTEAGYYYFDGTVWVKVGAGGKEPWYNAATNTEATENTQDIYQMGKIGINTDSPNTALHIVNDNGTDFDDDVYIESYGNINASTTYLRARGTKANPQQLQEWDALGSHIFRSYVGGTFVPAAAMMAHYRGNGSDNKASLLFRTSGLNSAVIDAEGNLGVGRTTNVMNPIARLDVRGAVRTGRPHADEISGASTIGYFSFTSGDKNIASGNNSFAIGTGTKATAASSFAHGEGSEASGIKSFAIGNGSKAIGASSFSWGSESQAQGNISFAGGSGTIASGGRSFAMGTNTTASGVNSVAFGNSTTVSGSAALVGGDEATATGNRSFSWGLRTHANGANSFVAGSGSTTTANQSIALGMFNETIGEGSISIGQGIVIGSQYSVGVGRYNAITGGNPTTNDYADAVFQVGVGLSDADRRNAFTVYKSGTVQFKEIPVYANDAAADADANLPSGALYKTTAGGRGVFQKP